jgi:hypothetical protein
MFFYSYIRESTFLLLILEELRIKNFVFQFYQINTCKLKLKKIIIILLTDIKVLDIIVNNIASTEKK